MADQVERAFVDRIVNLRAGTVAHQGAAVQDPLNEAKRLQGKVIVITGGASGIATLHNPSRPIFCSRVYLLKVLAARSVSRRHRMGRFICSVPSLLAIWL